MLTGAKEGLVKGIKKFFRFLSWLIPIAVVIVAVIFVVFRRSPNPAGPTDDPQHLLFSYVRAVVQFAPPATQLPVQQDFDNMLAFFSEKDRTWVKDNLNALAWLGMSQDYQSIRQADDQKKMQAAYRFIVIQGPSGALTYQGAKPPSTGEKTTKTPAELEKEIKDKAVITVSSPSRRWDVSAVLEGGRWRIEGLWGIPEKYGTQISQFTQRTQGAK